jgi:hypothetical protein
MHWEHDIDRGGAGRQELGDVLRKTGAGEPDMADTFAQGRRLGFCCKCKQSLDIGEWMPQDEDCVVCRRLEYRLPGSNGQHTIKYGLDPGWISALKECIRGEDTDHVLTRWATRRSFGMDLG